MNDASDSVSAEAGSTAAGHDVPKEALPRDYPKLVMLGILHMAQYFPAAFTGVALPAIFRQEGLPLEAFWLLALPGYPRWIKFLIALIVDNYGIARIGYRKTWIIPCTIIGTVLYAALAFIPPSVVAVYTIVTILTVKSFIMAAQDIAVDGYAAESMNEAERPIGTSLIGFLATAAGVLGAGVVALVDRFGWTPTMAVVSLLLLGFALPAIIRKEPPPPEASQKRRERGEKPSLINFMKRKDSWYIMPYLFGFGFAGAFGGSMALPFLIDKGLTLTQIGILAPISAFFGSGGAALLAPLLIYRIGLKKPRQSVCVSSPSKERHSAFLRSFPSCRLCRFSSPWSPCWDSAGRSIQCQSIIPASDGLRRPNQARIIVFNRASGIAASQWPLLWPALLPRQRAGLSFLP